MMEAVAVEAVSCGSGEGGDGHESEVAASVVLVVVKAHQWWSMEAETAAVEAMEQLLWRNLRQRCSASCCTGGGGVNCDRGGDYGGGSGKI